jgi:hypothetical protein
MAFEQHRFPATKVSIKWMENGLLSFHYRSFNKKITKLIKLIYLSENSHVLRHPSFITGFISAMGVILLALLPIAFVSRPETFPATSAFIVAESGLALLTLFFMTHFALSFRKKMTFYYKNGEVAFSIGMNEKLQLFQNELTKKIMESVVTDDNKSLQSLKTEISQLTKSGIISREFENILQERLLQINHI